MAEEQGQYGDAEYKGFEVPTVAPAAGGGGKEKQAGQYGDTEYKGFEMPKPKPTPKLTGDEDEIIRSFGYDPDKIKSSPLYQTVRNQFGSGFAVPGLQADQPEDQATGWQRGWLGDAVGAFGKGVLDPVVGTLQLGQHALAGLGINDERDTPYMDLLARFREENYRQNLGGTKKVHKALELGGNIASTSLLPGGGTSLAAGAGQGAVIGATTPVTEGDDYWKSKAVQTGVGTVGGAGGTLLGRGIARGAKAIAGYFKTPLPEEEANAISQMLNDRVEKGNWGDLSDLDQAIAGGNKGAQKVRQLLDAAGNDPEAIEHAAINLRNYRTQQQATQLYNQVGQIVRDKGLGEVPLDQGLAKIDGVLAELRQAKAKDDPLVHYIEGIRESLVPPRPVAAGPAPTNIGDYVKWKAAQQPQGTANNTYDLITGLVGDLGDRIRAERSGKGALLGPKAAGQLQQIKNALQRDVAGYIDRSGVPELKAAQTAADDYYRKFRVPFQDPNVAKAGSTDEPDTILNMFIKGGNRRSLAQKFYNSLDDRGRLAVQTQLVDKAIEDATDNVSGKVDAEAFLNAAQKYSKAYGVFFRGADQARYEGLLNLMRTGAGVNRAPLTGAGTAAEIAGTAGHFLGFPVAGKALATLGFTSQTAKLLLRTDAGRRLLYSAAGSKPFSAELAHLYGQLNRGIIPTMGRAGAVVPNKIQLSQQPWQLPAGMATGGPILDRMRANTFRSLGYEPARFADGGANDDQSPWDRFTNFVSATTKPVREAIGSALQTGQQNVSDIVSGLGGDRLRENLLHGPPALQRPYNTPPTALGAAVQKILPPALRQQPPDITQQVLKSRLPPAPPLPRQNIHDVALAHQINPETPLKQDVLTPLMVANPALGLRALFGPEGQAAQMIANPQGAVQGVLTADAPLVGTHGLGEVGPKESPIERPPAPEIAAPQTQVVQPQRVQAVERMVQPATAQDMAMLTREHLLSGGTYAGTPEAAEARARLVRQSITQMREQQLTPQEQEQFHQARQASPELHQVGDLMTPLEARKVIASPENVEAISKMLRTIPDSAKLAAAAKAGVSKLGWYRGSSQALIDVFGDDAPRAAQLLAAMSPQTSVESNLQNMLNMWKNWTAEGRPTDPADIRRIMGKSVQGTKGEKSVLDAWLGNTTRVLSAKDPMSVTLSGPKVDSFYHNLRDNVFRVTNDAWMANALGIVQEAFSGSPSELQLGQGDPGMTWKYAAASARVRDAALKAGMLPSQGQETMWSTAMQLYELAKREGIHPREALERGLLTPEIVRGAPDFSTLLKADPKYRSILEEAGYGPQLERLQSFQFPERSVPMSATEQEHLGSMADILGETAALRARESRSSVFQMPKTNDPPPSTAFSRTQVETTPGRRTGILSGLTDLPYGVRDYLTRAAMGLFKDPRGRDAMQTATGLDTIPMAPMIGSFKERGKPWDVDPGRSLGAEVPVNWFAPSQQWFGAKPTGIAEGWAPSLSPETRANLRGTAAAYAGLMGQAGVGVPVLVPREGGSSFRVELPSGTGAPKFTPEVMKQLSAKWPNLAFAHTGEGLEVLDINNLNLTSRQKQNVADFVGATKAPVNADNIGEYVDAMEAWKKKPGSGAVSTQMMNEINQMTPEQQAALDQSLREPAGGLHKLMSNYAKSKKLPMREDYLNLLATIRDHGLEGVRQGIKSGAFLPALAGAVLLPHLARASWQSPSSRQGSTD